MLLLHLSGTTCRAQTEDREQTCRILLIADAAHWGATPPPPHAPPQDPAQVVRRRHQRKICRHPLIFAREMRSRRNVGPLSYVACMHRVVVLEGTDELGVAEVHAVCGHIYSVRMLDMFRTHIVERPAMEPARSRFLWH